MNNQAIHLETGQEPADVLLGFLETVDRPNLFINFDPANMILYGCGEPIEALKKVGKYVRSVHCKDGRWSDKPGETWGEETALGAGAERTPEGGVKRVSRRDGIPATATELAQAARMTWLTPAMDRLWSGPAGDRRRFFDRLTLARAAEHGSAAAAYERAMRERQRLLSDRVFDDAWLGGLEREMSAHGAAIAAARVETLLRLQGAIDARPESAFPKAELALAGFLEQRFETGAASADVEEDFAALLRDVRGRDAGAGRTLDGPHRSDLKARHAAKQIDAEQCSTGEQKALLLGVTLAQARALAEDPGAGASLLLIDEAAAHLDTIRRAALFEELLANPGQAWLTGTDENLFEAFGARAQRFEVRDGRVREA